MRKHGGMAPSQAVAAAVEHEERAEFGTGDATAVRQGAEQEADA